MQARPRRIVTFWFVHEFYDAAVMAHVFIMLLYVRLASLILSWPGSRIVL